MFLIQTNTVLINREHVDLLEKEIHRVEHLIKRVQGKTQSPIFDHLLHTSQYTIDNKFLTRRGFRKLVKESRSFPKKYAHFLLKIDQKVWLFAIKKLRFRVKKLNRLINSPEISAPPTSPSSVSSFSPVSANRHVLPTSTSSVTIVKKMTSELCPLYRHIAVNFFQKKNADRVFADDGKGNLIVREDDLVKDYRIIQTIGRGTFGQVFRCQNMSDGKLYALKIVNSRQNYTAQAEVEVNILQQLCLGNVKNVVRPIRTFMFNSHRCIVFELLSNSLYELTVANRQIGNNGFSLVLVRKFAHQLLETLQDLQNNAMIHCDIKPENILLVHPQRSAIKLIDFGSSNIVGQPLHTYIQSRWYRAPEVILGLPYGPEIDMFSLGCVLAELYTGQPLFPGADTADQLDQIIATLGVPPDSILSRGKKTNVYFTQHSDNSFTYHKDLPKCVPLAQHLGNGNHHTQPFLPHYVFFEDLIREMLRWPSDRIKPAEALSHQFFHMT